MRTAITTITLIALVAFTAILLSGMNETAAAQTIISTTATPADFAGAPWILGAGLFALVGLGRVRPQN